MNSALNPSLEKSLWNSDKVTKQYADDDYLLKPEQAILNIMRNRLPQMRMLDLGIGGGRTTVHFAPLCKEYVGSDYAEKMVDACVERFPNPGPSIRFEVIDATDMKGVPDQYFDFILFSFNSIDCVPPEDRHKVLEEVRRVGKPGGLFAFSSHNLRYLRRMYAIKRHRKLKDFLYQFYRSLMLIYYNGLPSRYDNKDYGIICNGVEHFSLNLYYGKPEFQVKQLRDAGFKNIRAFTNEETDVKNLHKVTDQAWIHYLCEI
ncbi:MAG: class I SAM-dependent methyltransferase [Saprospirales bacterium]|nr:class I SAM-dependent methyltransferase [Saprospirales bacterium]